MRGIWLTALTRRIIRTETFESLVAPALADLQYEAASGRPIARHYAAIVIVIATALLRDLRVDVQLTFSARRVWRRAGAWYAGFVLFYVATVLYSDTPWHLLDATGQAAALAYALAIGVVAPLPYALVAAVFYLRRESVAPRRTIAIAAMAFIAAAFAFQFTTASVRPAANRMLVDSASRVIAQHRPGAGLDDRNRYPGHWQSWLEVRRQRSGSPPLGLNVLAFLNFAPYVMFGMVLAHGRRWTVFFRVLGLFVTYAVVQITTITLQIPLLTGPYPGHEAIRQMVAMFLTALAWLLGVRLLLLPLLPVYALTKARRLVPRRSSRLP